MKKIVSFLMAAVMLMGVAGMTVSAAFGDANADGSATIKDVILLQKYLANWDVTVDPVLADVNKDGGVNIQDVIVLQKLLANWEVPPYVTLPAIGTDIDVAKKKNRICISEASAVLNENGDIDVILTFKNQTRNWITEETDWVEYTCYGANGAVVQKATKIYIGCIDTKIKPVKAFKLEVPATTAEIKLTNSSIVYWTEWA